MVVGEALGTLPELSCVGVTTFLKCHDWEWSIRFVCCPQFYVICPSKVNVLYVSLVHSTPRESGDPLSSILWEVSEC